MSRAVRFGARVAVAVTFGLAHLGAFVAAASTSPTWVPLVAARPDAAPGLIAAVIAAGLLVVAAFVASFRGASRVQHGTPGRGRIMAMASAGVLYALSSTTALAWMLYACAHSRLGFLHTLRPTDILTLADPLVQAALSVSLAIAVSTGVVLLGTIVGAWFLLPPRFRRKFFAVVDVALLGALVYSVLELPLEPPPDAPRDLALPITRLGITSLFVIRLALQLVPLGMYAVERTGFQALVAARHLRARKSNFLAAIGSLSILAVAVSSCMLTTVLSVMGGFRNDLQQKILGNHAHVVVDRELGRIEGWEPTLAHVVATRGVTAATPVASGEVMVTSASNLAGAVLRGVDTETVGRVSDLENNLVRGQLEYLTRPERLLHLSPEERSPLGSTALLSPPRPGESIVDGAPSLGFDSTEDPEHEDMGLQRFLDEDKDGPERDVLPGIIVGRELARTLRVVVGDDIEVVSPLGDLGPTGPIPKTRAFRVAGIFYSGMYEYDMKHVYVTLPVAQRFLNMGDAITGIDIAVADVERAPAVGAAIARAIDRPELRVQDWQELNRNLFGALALEKLAMFVTLGIAILIAGFCVFGTLTLMVQEKGREVGILKAMGSSGPAIIGIFLIEGLLIGLLGAGLGLGLGFVVAFAAEHFGIRMNPEVYYIDRLPVHIDSTEFTLVGLAAVAVCVLATLFPAYLASNTRPVDALRYD